MKIYLDFDRTLFDTDKFIKDIDILCNKYNINETNYYNKVLEIDKFDNKLKDMSKYLYPDVESSIRELKKTYSLNILTRGEDKFQRLKIERSLNINLFDEIITLLDEKGKQDIDYKNSCFVDDNPNELESIMNSNPYLIFRIKRLGSKYSEYPFNKKIEEITSLKELVCILKCKVKEKNKKILL